MRSSAVTSPFLRSTRLVLVLCSLVPPIVSFSRGASHASCQEMTPGHIRAHPLDPLHSYVSIRTTASFYLPGQLITVTVRSSRDFMGFLLQGRSVGVMRSTIGGGAGIRPVRLGPLLVGGSWVLIPPGTHTIRCLSEGDTVTHSDKQLKRNLSFVWRAPDAPMGDIRFHITVVQSYFVYWAGVETAVVRDGSRSGWRGRNVTAVDGQTTMLTTLEEEVTALRAHENLRASKTQAYRTKGSATTLGHPTRSGSRTLVNKPVRTPTEVSRLTLVSNSSVTLTNHTVNEGNTLISGGSQSKTPTTQSSLSGVSKETVFDPGLHTEDCKNSPFTSSPSSTDTRQMGATVTLFPNITEQLSTSSLSLLSYLVTLFPLKHVETESQDVNINNQEPKLNTNVETKDKTLTPETATLLISDSFHKTNTQRPSYHNSRGPIQLQQGSEKFDNQMKSEELHRRIETKYKMSPVNVERGSVSQTSSPTPSQFLTSTSKQVIQSQTDTSWTSPISEAFLPKPQTSLPYLVLSPKSPMLKSFSASSITHVNPLSLKPGRQSEKILFETTAKLIGLPKKNKLLSSTLQPQSLSHFQEVLVDNIHTTPKAEPVFLQTDQSQREKLQVSSTSPQTSSQPIFQTGKTLTQSSVTPLPVNTLFLTSRSDPVFTVHRDLKSRAQIRTTSPVFDLSASATPSPFFSTSSSFPSSDSFHTFSEVQTTPTIPLHLSESLAQISMRTPISSTLPIHSSSSSSSLKNKLKTPPVVSALPFPSPVSMPPHLPSAQPSSSSPLKPQYTSFTDPHSRSPSRPSPAPLFSPIPASTSSSPPFNSSQCKTSSTFSSLSSSSTTPPSSSSSSASISFASSPTSPPPTSSSIHTSTSSSSVTSPHLEPSPAPRRSLHTPLKSPASSQKLPVGQTLIIQTHIMSPNPKPNLNPSTQRSVVHPNPKPHPNLRLNPGQELRPNTPNTDNRAKPPSGPSETPDKDRKYPDIIPRHTAWELGMLLGCSAGLGMALVVGVRYMYSKACGRRTDVTLNDREREYGRGERGLIQVEECGDLVRVRKIRENSFVLLTEYDILAPPGN